MKPIKLNLKDLAIVAIVSLSLISCSTDEESINTTIYYSSRATVISAEGDPLIFRTDGDNKLTIVSDYSGYAPEQNQRVLIAYSIENKLSNAYDANLYSVHDILTKGVVELTAENEHEMGNDAIHLYDAWCAGGCLNINWGINVGGKITHYVNLVENTMVENPEDGKVYLEFRHNANGDREIYSKRGTVCYNLQPYKKEESPVIFVIKFTEFNGVTTIREIKYDFVNDTIVMEDGEQADKELYKYSYCIDEN